MCVFRRNKTSFIDNRVRELGVCRTNRRRLNAHVDIFFCSRSFSKISSLDSTTEPVCKPARSFKNGLDTDRRSENIGATLLRPQRRNARRLRAQRRNARGGHGPHQRRARGLCGVIGETGLLTGSRSKSSSSRPGRYRAHCSRGERVA